MKDKMRKRTHWPLYLKSLTAIFPISQLGIFRWVIATASVEAELPGRGDDELPKEKTSKLCAQNI